MLMLVLRQQLLVLSRNSEAGPVAKPRLARLGLYVPPVSVAARCDHCRQAGNFAPLESTRVSSVLAWEVLAARWPAQELSRKLVN